VALDLHTAYRLHPSVALRPEPFGALAYHYGNRKLVFLKTPKMVEVVRTLGDHASVEAALLAAGVPERSHTKYLEALASLEKSEMLEVA
jgi:putative mycofactocin binding protein MftB